MYVDEKISLCMGVFIGKVVVVQPLYRSNEVIVNLDTFT
jgi:hypothetical protein